MPSHLPIAWHFDVVPAVAFDVVGFVERLELLWIVRRVELFLAAAVITLGLLELEAPRAVERLDELLVGGNRHGQRERRPREQRRAENPDFHFAIQVMLS